MIPLVIAPLAVRFRIRSIRLLGCDVTGLWLCLFFLAVLLVEFILPAPQYYINARDPRYGSNLNKILEQEALNAGIDYEEGSFRILESRSLHLQHLFLCSYRVDGSDEARIFHLEKNIFGNMKPAEPFLNAQPIPQDGDPEHFYRSFVNDGFFGTYLVTAGYAPADTVWDGRVVNGFYIEAIHLQGHFLIVELIEESWKKSAVRLLLYFLILLIGRIFHKKYKAEKFYTGWKKGDKLFQIRFVDDGQPN